MRCAVAISLLIASCTGTGAGDCVERPGSCVGSETLTSTPAPTLGGGESVTIRTRAPVLQSLTVMVSGRTSIVGHPVLVGDPVRVVVAGRAVARVRTTKTADAAWFDFALPDEFPPGTTIEVSLNADAGTPGDRWNVFVWATARRERCLDCPM